MKALGLFLVVPAMLRQVLASQPFMIDIDEVRTDDFQPQQIHIAIGGMEISLYSA